MEFRYPVSEYILLVFCENQDYVAVVTGGRLSMGKSDGWKYYNLARSIGEVKCMKFIKSSKRHHFHIRGGLKHVGIFSLGADDPIWLILLKSVQSNISSLFFRVFFLTGLRHCPLVHTPWFVSTNFYLLSRQPRDMFSFHKMMHDVHLWGWWHMKLRRNTKTFWNKHRGKRLTPPCFRQGPPFSTTCMKCPKGTATRQIGSTECFPCQAGMFWLGCFFEKALEPVASCKFSQSIFFFWVNFNRNGIVYGCEW